MDSTLEHDERVEMLAAMRVADEKGEPQVANLIRKKLNAGEFYLPDDVLSQEPPADLRVSPPSKNASTSEWRDYASEVSSVEDEVLESSGRGDIITMLESLGVPVE